MGGAATARERAAAGLNPVAGLDIGLEDAERMPQLRRHRHGRGAVGADRERQPAAQERPAVDAAPARAPGEIRRRHRHQDGRDFEPAGDQPTAIKDLVEGVGATDRTQVLLGVTGSGKTFTMAKVIEETQRPALILAPNKTLAAQLYSEFKKFFPDNAVEYFVSYYDYYQPEAYVPRTDTYIEKESSINEQIDRMRHSATRSLLERDDVVIVASVSCIYGIGSVETYTAMTFQMQVGDRLDQRQLLADLVAQQYKRQDVNFVRGSFRVRGDTIEIFPAHLEDRAWRITMFGDEIEIDHRVRSADRPQDRRPEERQDLRQLALCDAAPDAQPGDQVDQGRAGASASPNWRRPGACWRRSGWSSAPASTWRCWRRPAPAPASRTIRAISPAASPAIRRRRCSNTSPTTR